MGVYYVLISTYSNITEDCWEVEDGQQHGIE